MYLAEPALRRNGIFFVFAIFFATVLLLLLLSSLLLLEGQLGSCFHLLQINLLKHFIFVILAIVVLYLNNASASCFARDAVPWLDVWQES